MQAYDAYIADQEAAFESARRRRRAGRAPRAVAAHRLRRRRADRAGERDRRRCSRCPGVVAVQQDKLDQLLTDSSTEFIGADDLYPQPRRHGQRRRRASSSASSTPASGPSTRRSPTRATSPRRRHPADAACDFGDNPLTPAADPFACNNKLIGGQTFLDTYLAIATAPRPSRTTTARDSNGHGTHTGIDLGRQRAGVGDRSSASTRGPIAGIAPGA